MKNFHPKEHPDYPGFYYIPDENYCRYVINIYGIVKTIYDCPIKKTGAIIKNSITDTGYYLNWLYVNNGEYIRVRNHRLVCLAFHGPHPIDKPYVNHKDGIRNNNYYTNLEWCSHKENMQHAYDTGLSTRRIPVLIWDTVNDPNKENLSEFKSLTDAAKFCNCSISLLSMNLNNERLSLFLSKFVIDYKTEQDTFPPLKTILHNSKIIPVYAYNIYTGETIVCKDAVELAKKFNVPSIVIQKSYSRHLPVIRSGWIIYRDKEIDLATIKKRFLEIYPRIVCHDLVCNDTKIYLNCSELSKELDGPYSTLVSYIKGKRYKYRDFIIYAINNEDVQLDVVLDAFNLKKVKECNQDKT